VYVNEQMHHLGSNRSVIRELFEYGKIQRAKVGDDNVYDFSIGNPSSPPPKAFQQALIDLLQTMDPISLHAYTSAQGDLSVRRAIAEHINGRFGTAFTADNLYLTSGAAAAITLCIKAVLLPEKNEEVLVFAPYFTEYRTFTEGCGGKLVVVPPKMDDFQIDFLAFEAALNPRTKVVIVNSPNNPSGVIYSEETIVRLCDILRQKEKEYGHPIYLLSDEPYREIVYSDAEVPYLTKYYKNTFVCYSYSKSLSLPGERFGYALVSGEMEDWQNVYYAVCGAGRALGYICAPSLFQYAVARCLGMTSDLSSYRVNRDLLLDSLTAYGYHCATPDGAFYLFVEALEKDANAFSEQAKKHNLLLVPGDDFGCPGWVRVSYCVSTDMIRRSLSAFQALAKEYGK